MSVDTTSTLRVRAEAPRCSYHIPGHTRELLACHRRLEQREHNVSPDPNFLTSTRSPAEFIQLDDCCPFLLGACAAGPQRKNAPPPDHANLELTRVRTSFRRAAICSSACAKSLRCASAYRRSACRPGRTPPPPPAVTVRALTLQAAPPPPLPPLLAPNPRRRARDVDSSGAGSEEDVRWRRARRGEAGARAGWRRSSWSCVGSRNRGESPTRR